MTNINIYQDIATRTNGNIYIGVVGPVRTGKSTFIRKVMEHLVLDEITDPFVRERTIDELPQASTGKTIMTTEPKFVPENAIQINLGNESSCNIRMVDCVGFVVDSALGQMENNEPRMVNTPWSDQEMPFEKAAEIGTQKVIREHSTISVVVTTDGSIGDIPREEYLSAEKRVISEMKSCGKPFVVVLNSMFPDSEQACVIKNTMESEYDVPVIVKNCNDLSLADVEEILSSVLLEFPISKVNFILPSWVTYLENNNAIKNDIFDCIRSCAEKNTVIRSTENICAELRENKYFESVEIKNKALGDGSICIEVKLPQYLYFGMISDVLGKEIADDGDLLVELKDLSKAKTDYSKIKNAFDIARQKGYGIVTPEKEDLVLEKPESYRQGNRYGIKVKATAPTYHVIKADIYSEISPIVGDEVQSEKLLEFMHEQYGKNDDEIWNYNIFGKSIYEMVGDGLESKFDRLPDDARFKLQETLSKVLNEGSGGLICIIL